MCMSVLTHKKALIIGPENDQILSLSKSLQTQGVEVIKQKYDEVTEMCFTDCAIDFVILNNLIRDSLGIQLLKKFSTSLVEKAIPVFAFVEDTPEAIQEVLSLGVADYISLQEDVPSIVAKIKAIFGHSEAFTSGIAIDISPHETVVTKTGIRVFIVEDDPMLRNLLALQLEKTHFPYEFSTDGNNIAAVIQQFKPNIVILDLMLPGRTGFELLVDIKADERVKHIPVIVFSNRDSQEDKAKARALGAEGFYVKAMTDLSELMETIESIAR